MGLSPGGSAVVVTWPQDGLTVALTGNAMAGTTDLLAVANEIAAAWREAD